MPGGGEAGHNAHSEGAVYLKCGPGRTGDGEAEVEMFTEGNEGKEGIIKTVNRK
jgi:hypothetical protein